MSRKELHRYSNCYNLHSKVEVSSRKGFIARSRIFLLKIRLQLAVDFHLLSVDYNSLSFYSILTNKQLALRNKGEQILNLGWAG